jgi:hypothetical protein
MASNVKINLVLVGDFVMADEENWGLKKME